MFRYLKAAPTTWVMQLKSGKVKREGAGLSFFYWAPTTTLATVPARRCRASQTSCGQPRQMDHCRSLSIEPSIRVRRSASN